VKTEVVRKSPGLKSLPSSTLGAGTKTKRGRTRTWCGPVSFLVLFFNMMIDYGKYNIADTALIELLEIYFVQMLRINTLELGLQDDPISSDLKSKFFQSRSELQETYRSLLSRGQINGDSAEQLIRLFDGQFIH